MSYRIIIGANRAKMTKLVAELNTALANEGDINITFWGKRNGHGSGDVELMFSNDDLEDRDDLTGDEIIIDIEKV